MEAKKIRTEAVREGHALGFSYTPLAGKRPRLKNWQNKDRESIGVALKWAKGGNVGIRTGDASGGLVVVDIDDGAETDQFDFPNTVTVKTGNGGIHLYYKSKINIRNSASRLAAKIDIRGNGGQVVAVGSVHPDTGEIYNYMNSPDKIEIAPLPDWIVEKIQEKKKTKTGKANSILPSIGGSPYGRAALQAECDALYAAAEGTRNHALNSAAFSLGQLVAGGELNKDEVESALLSSSSLPDSEARKTFESGFEAGMEQPRSAPKPPPMPPARVREEKGVGPVLVPGQHTTSYAGTISVGNHDFVNDAIGRFPEGSIWRRGGIVVELTGERGQMKPKILSADAMRLKIDAHMQLGQWIKKHKNPYVKFKAASRDHASIVLAAAAIDTRIPEIKLFTNYPVYREGWELTPPGYDDGIYYDEPEALEGIDPAPNMRMIEDAVVDFPWASYRDLTNYIGFLLTPLIRPAIAGNVPLHMIKSSRPGTGKSKLVEEVGGGIFEGRRAPAMQLTGHDDERDKRIIALLLMGETMVHIDNVGAYIDSPALASLLTARHYRGRVLGASKMADLENNMTLVATANNPTATGEIVRRIVPITLQPKTDSPETRTDFVHHDIYRFITRPGKRREILSALIGMIEKWKDHGKPNGKQPMGSFEEWAGVIGGVLEINSVKGWMENWRDWVVQSDPEGEDLRLLVATWAERMPHQSIHASMILELCEEEGLFGNLLSRSKTDHGRLTIFATNILAKYMNAPVGEWVIRRNARREYRLEELI